MKLRFLPTLSRLAAIGLVTLAGTSAMAQITKQGNGFLMRMKFVAGQTTSYTVTSQNSMPGMAQPMTFSLPMKTTVKTVKNGVATIDAVVGPAKMGQQTMPEQKTTMTMNARGQVTGADASMQQFQSVQFPAGPIAVGGTWSSDMKMSSGPMGSMSIRSTYRVVRTVTRNGIPLLEIAVSGSSTGNAQMKMTMTGSMFLRMADGSLQSSTTNQSVSFQAPAQQQGKAGQPMNIKGTTTITRK